jgi:glutamate receptor ionotropic, NMDA 2B
VNFSQLAGYLGIPVISWNADNSGLERRASQSTLQLQLAPSIEHQAAAMLSILERYKWHQFSVVTSQIAGHDDFVQAVREHVVEQQERFKFTILNSIIVTRPSDLVDLVNSEARVMLLYCTKGEAIDILKGNFCVLMGNYRDLESKIVKNSLVSKSKIHIFVNCCLKNLLRFSIFSR